MRDLTQGNIHTTFLKFSIPIILSSILSSAFSIINTSIAGKYLGDMGLAATGATSAFVVFLQSFYYGVAYGISVYAAKLFAAKRYRELKESLYSNLLFVALTAAVLAAVLIPLYRPIFHFLKVEDAIWEDTRVYFFLLLVHMLPSMCNHCMLYACNAMGETAFPFYMSVLSAVLTIGGNLASVVGLGLGVAGLGLSNIFSSVVVLLLYLLRFRTYFRELGVGKEPIRFRLHAVKHLFSYSLPNIFQQGSMYICSLLRAPLQNALGYTVIASMSIIDNIISLHDTVYYAAARTSGNYISQCMGARKYNQFQKAIGVALYQGLLSCLLVMVVVYCFPVPIAQFFLNEESDPAVLGNVVQYIRWYLPFLLLHVVGAVFHSVFRGAKSGTNLIVSSLLFAVVDLLAAYVLTPTMGIVGLHISKIIAWSCELLFIAVVYFSGLWLPKALRAEIKQADARKSKETLPPPSTDAAAEH